MSCKNNLCNRFDRHCSRLVCCNTFCFNGRSFCMPCEAESRAPDKTHKGPHSFSRPALAVAIRAVPIWPNCTSCRAELSA
eukprot:1212393-Amphidinium_carterae.1